MSSDTEDSKAYLKVAEGYTRDVGRGVARIDHESMSSAGISEGDIIQIIGGRRTVARCLPLYPSDEGKKIIRIDGLVQANSNTKVGETVRVRKVTASNANRVVVRPHESIPPLDEHYLSDALNGVPVVQGDTVLVPYFGGRLAFKVVSTEPQDVVVVNQQTIFFIASGESMIRYTITDLVRQEEGGRSYMVIRFGLQGFGASVAGEFQKEIAENSGLLKTWNRYFDVIKEVVAKRNENPSTIEIASDANPEDILRRIKFEIIEKMINLEEHE
ncbi:hypothetical protein [Nitrososphaera sp.]|uniref:hypothetical protein n=1 Tax=Nitrososphaera sp. TaxID=1971748 RepID=UPI00307F5A79